MRISQDSSRYLRAQGYLRISHDVYTHLENAGAIYSTDQKPGGYRQVGRGSACKPSKLSMRGDRVSDVPFGLIALHDLVGVTAGAKPGMILSRSRSAGGLRMVCRVVQCTCATRSGIAMPSSLRWARSTRRRSSAHTAICGPGSSASSATRCASPRRSPCLISCLDASSTETNWTTPVLSHQHV